MKNQENGKRKSKKKKRGKKKSEKRKKGKEKKREEKRGGGEKKGKMNGERWLWREGGGRKTAEQQHIRGMKGREIGRR